jgi:opacity protein-like surface antigen
MRYQNSPLLPCSTLLRAAALAATLLAAASAQAADDAPPPATAPTWTFSGFGSIGVAHSDYREADYVPSAFSGDGAGATHAWSTSLDSRVGGQLGVTFDKRWSGVLQVVVEQRYDRSWQPKVEWANIKYQATPDLALRAGRIALPIFLAADYRKIGYAYPWVRTPIEFYGGIPITNSDGVDLAYRWQAFGIKHTTQAFYGRTDIHLTDTTSVHARGITGLTHTAEVGALTLRASAFTAMLNVDVVRPLFDGFRQFGAPGIAIADKYDVVDKRTTGLALGLNYDPGQWFVMAEAGVMNGHSYLAKTVGKYVSTGYRAGAFTPYVNYSRSDALSPTTHPGLSLAGLPPPYAYAAAQLNANLATLLQAIPSQTSITAGVRWDFRSDMALKLQYDRVRPRNNSRGSLVNLQPGFVSGHPVNVTSAVLDVVF